MSWRVSENLSPSTSVHTHALSQPVLEFLIQLDMFTILYLTWRYWLCCLQHRMNQTKLQITFFSTCTDGVMLISVGRGVELLSVRLEFGLCLRPRSLFSFPLCCQCLHIVTGYIYIYFFLDVISCQQRANPEKHVCVVFLLSFRSRSQLLVCRSTQRSWSLLFALNITRVFA